MLTVWGVADMRKLEEVRVIHTDEALMIARSVACVLNLGPYRKPQP